MAPGTVVKRSSITGFRQRQPESAPAALLAKLLELKADKAYTLTVKSLEDGAHIRARVSKLARKEGYQLGWNRNQDGSVIYLWLQKEEAA